MAFTLGEPNTFSKTRGVIRGFCPTCGTSISYFDQGLADEIYLSIGFMDNPERFAPDAHSYWELRLPFIEMNDGLPRSDTYTRLRDPKLGNPNERKD